MDFDKNNKSNFLGRNVEEIRGYVINETNKIEAKIDNVIINYFKPKENKKFKKIILNSSIITFGSKIKILTNIDGFDKKEIEKIRKLSAIRNSFAHIPILVHFDLKQIPGSVGEFEIKSISDKIEVMNSSGKLESKFVKSELETFELLKNEITKYFNDFF